MASLDRNIHDSDGNNIVVADIQNSNMYDSDANSITSSYGAFNTMTSPEYEINRGNRYIATVEDAGLAASSTFKYLLQTGALSAQGHLCFKTGSNEGRLKINFYSSCTIAASGSGTVVTVPNRNLRSANTHTIYLTSDASTTANGTLLFTDTAATGQEVGSLDRDQKWVLREGTTYLFELVANDASLTANTTFDWSEADGT